MTTFQLKLQDEKPTKAIVTESKWKVLTEDSTGAPCPIPEPESGLRTAISLDTPELDEFMNIPC